MLKTFMLFMLVLSLAAGPVYSMSTAKDWVNQIKPGTFEDPNADTTADILAAKERTFSAAEMKVLTDLRKREQVLRSKEEDFSKKTQELKLLSQQIEQKLDQMRSLQSLIEKRRQERKQMDEKDITRMVKYYETMGADSTAVFFNRMERNTATQIIMRMNPRKASAVMQLMDPKVAVDITERVTRFKDNRQELSPNR